MGGGRHKTAHGPDGLDNGGGQRRALHRVGARAQLVEENEGAVVRLLQNGDDVHHVGGEGGQGLVDGLLVADVRHDHGAHLDGGAVSGGDMQAALSHKSQQAQRFQGDGLAAGVGAGDDQRVKVPAQRQIVAHGGLLVQQRVPGPAQLDVVSQHRLHGPHPGGQAAPGKNGVQCHQQLVILLDAVLKPGAVGGQLRQNALDLLFLPGLKLPQLVVGIHHAHGLDEEGAAGAGHVVDKAGDVVLMLALHRDDVAAPPHGDDGVL